MMAKSVKIFDAISSDLFTASVLFISEILKYCYPGEVLDFG